MKINFRSILLATVFIFGTSFMSQAQKKENIKHVEPPFWWVGMKNSNLQLLIHGDNIAKYDASIDYPGVQLKTSNKVENPNYLFLDISISETANPGNLKIRFKNGKTTFDHTYTLKSRENSGRNGQLVTPSDVMYLITPDRFANGDVTNDSTDDTIEKENRKDMNGRHGGDLKGILDHFEYIEELGVTTLWLNPFLENDQPAYSYHGYGISDFYKTDSRFGNNDDFITLVNKSHQKGMKVIMDQVFNHCGAGHWWMNDLPSKDWLNQWDTFTRSNFTNIAAGDPYVSQSDFNLLTKGWFDTNLPDLNLENKLLQTYMIQNSIWWVEYSGIDGIRMDTYPYPYKEAMANWMQALTTEYPNFYMVAETWAERASYLSYWNNDKQNRDGYTPYVNSVSDYPLYYSMIRAFEPNGDISELYKTLAEDFVYGNPGNNKIFNGNHDVDRLLALLDGDVEKLKLSMVFTLTTRGIPQIYYGDEILMKNKRPDGKVRQDFPGGWKGDKRNAFTKAGRTPEENSTFNYIKTILNWRKNAKSIHEGKLTHYQPLDNVYVYFRHTDSEKTMVIINNSKKGYKGYDLRRFRESIGEFVNAKDILTGKDFRNLNKIDLPGNSALILELSK
ncbi:glycoside hydrolase family 13 protein [Aquimarina sp. MMG016]|uniref:glycoside hydrolase family 13 protein n=1 Tax=Aquimarina sp. MMG016 TaxID=2822690 RepID=UPI001B3A3F84|nr:glycoside hydrolase family 13 protein [Aquimarina sp. MMG016]MBQ4821952.1 glycoside hydrolase family 13 protein [Aquimarina sp. MMG016]